MEVGVDGGEDGVFGVGGSGVGGDGDFAGGRVETAVEAKKGVHGLRVAGADEAVEGAEDTEGRGLGRPSCLSVRDFGGEDGAGGGSVDDDVVGLVGLEQFFVDGDGVIDGGGERVFGGETVKDRDDLDAGVAGDGDGLGVGAGVGVEPPPWRLRRRSSRWPGESLVGGDDVDGNAGDRGLFDGVGAERGPGGG